MTIPPSQFVFTSKRLGYRFLGEEDFENYFKLDSDSIVKAYMQRLLDPEQVKHNLQKHIDFRRKHGIGVFIAIELETGEWVGRCGFDETPSGEIELGLVFFQKFWGRGLGTEAVTALLQWAQIHTNLKRVIARTAKNHITARRSLEKGGMLYDMTRLDGGVMTAFYKFEFNR